MVYDKRLAAGIRRCQIMDEDEFIQGKVDQCVFSKSTDVGTIMVLIYVDDILIASTNGELIQQFKENLKAQVNIRDLEEVKQFIGLQINFQPVKMCFTVSREANHRYFRKF